MNLSISIKKVLFLGFAILSFLAAIYHLIGIFYKINDSPAWRHAVFVVVGLFCAYGFIKRPKYFIVIYIFLTIQQFYSHGQHLIRLWNMEHRIHSISIAVIIFLSIGLLCLLADFRRNKIAESEEK